MLEIETEAVAALLFRCSFTTRYVSVSSDRERGEHRKMLAGSYHY
jgi:hypothetical protein